MQERVRLPLGGRPTRVNARTCLTFTVTGRAFVGTVGRSAHVDHVFAH